MDNWCQIHFKLLVSNEHQLQGYLNVENKLERRCYLLMFRKRKEDGGVYIIWKCDGCIARGIKKDRSSVA